MINFLTRDELKSYIEFKFIQFTGKVIDSEYVIEETELGLRECTQFDIENNLYEFDSGQAFIKDHLQKWLCLEELPSV